MSRPLLRMTVAALLLGTSTFADDREPFALRDGDRVALIGSTIVERDAESGYLETRLTARRPDRELTFRNLGWSGDTVFGEARAGFDTPAEGFQRLVEAVTEARPTVVVVGYGAVESFEGEAGLSRFRDGLNRLLDALAPTGARFVLLAPNRQEDLGPPLPDPSAHNRDLALYRDAIRDVARARDLPFIDLFDAFPDAIAKGTPLTDDGLHFTPLGAWRAAAVVAGGLGEPPWPDPALNTFRAPDGALTFRATADLLPPPPPPGSVEAPEPFRVVQVRDLPPGRYTLTADGRAVATADADGWAAGVPLAKGPDLDQTEALRAAINAKNQLFFYRWRPQNQTYLFGFRKHEQGQNAKEVFQFDPLVAGQEDRIRALRSPVEHVYELTPEESKAP